MIRLGQFRGTRIRFGGTAPTSSFPFHSPHRYAVARRFIVSSIPRVVQAGRKEYPRLSDEKAARRYFDLLEKIEAAKSAKDYHALLHGCIASLPLVERYTKWFKKAQSGNPVQVPAIYYACRFLPITGGRGQLDNILELVEFLPEIDHYREGVQRAIASIRTVESIRAYLTKNAGTKQNQLKKALAYDNGRYLSQLVKDTLPNYTQCNRKQLISLSVRLCFLQSPATLPPLLLQFRGESNADGGSGSPRRHRR